MTTIQPVKTIPAVTLRKVRYIASPFTLASDCDSTALILVHNAFTGLTTIDHHHRKELAVQALRIALNAFH